MFDFCSYNEDLYFLHMFLLSNTAGSRSLLNLPNLLWLQVKIFENLAGVDRQFTTQLDQKLLTAAATNHGTVSQESASTNVSEPLLHVDDEMTAGKRNDAERIEKINGSASSSPSMQEADHPLKELERQMWMDRVNDSARGSTSSSSSRSSVQSPARLAKPFKPAPIPADKKRFADGNAVTDVAGAQRNSWQSSAIEQFEKEDTMQLYSEELDNESDLDRVLANVRKQLAAGDIRAAHGTLQKVSPFVITSFIHDLSCIKVVGDLDLCAED